MPPPALTGRPRSFCSAQCRRANEWIVVSRNREEKEQRDRQRREAKWQAKQDEAARRREQEYQQAIRAGGDVAEEARWQRLYDETLDKFGGRLSLCQWEDEDSYRRCSRRTTNFVYCAMHDRQLEREAEQRRRKAAQAASGSPTGMR